MVTAADFSQLMLDSVPIDSKGNQSIGWLAGLYTLVLCIAVGLLLWSFIKMARRAREPWDGEQNGSVEIDRAEPPTS